MSLVGLDINSGSIKIVDKENIPVGVKIICRDWNEISNNLLFINDLSDTILDFIMEETNTPYNGEKSYVYITESGKILLRVGSKNLILNDFIRDYSQIHSTLGRLNFNINFIPQTINIDCLIDNIEKTKGKAVIFYYTDGIRVYVKNKFPCIPLFKGISKDVDFNGEYFKPLFIKEYGGEIESEEYMNLLLCKLRDKTLSSSAYNDLFDTMDIVDLEVIDGIWRINF